MAKRKNKTGDFNLLLLIKKLAVPITLVSISIFIRLTFIQNVTGNNVSVGETGENSLSIINQSLGSVGNNQVVITLFYSLLVVAVFAFVYILFVKRGK